MAWLEERPLQRAWEAIGPVGPEPGSVVPGPEGGSFTVEPPPAPSGILPPEPAVSSGMAPYNISDQSVKSFVESPFMQQARGAQNIGNVPMGEFLRLLMNQEPAAPTIPPAPTGGGLIPVQNVAPSPQTPGMSREQLEAAGPQGILPWDWYAKNPDFAGGVMKVGQPTRWDMARKLTNVGFSVPQMNREEMLSALKLQPGQPGQIPLGSDDELRKMMDARGTSYFKMSDADMQKQLHLVGGDLAGKLYSLVEPKQDTGIQAQANRLIGQWTEKISDALTRGDTNAAYSYGKSLKDLISQLPPLMTAQSGVAKIPAEIANLEAQAKREQIVTGVPTGKTPGEVTAYRAAPGQAPTPFATGISPTGGHSEQVQATLITNALNKNSDRKMRALLANPNYMTDPQGAMTQLKPLFDQLDEETRQEINGIPAIIKSTTGSVVPTQGAAPGRKMTWSEYYTKAKGLGHSDDSIRREGAALLQQGQIVR